MMRWVGRKGVFCYVSEVTNAPHLKGGLVARTTNNLTRRLELSVPPPLTSRRGEGLEIESVPVANDLSVLPV